MADEGKVYFINCHKARDACSIEWVSEKYNIQDLKPYLYSIQCDDGENFHELIHPEWPHAEGKNDFETISINDFEAVEGDNKNDFLLCFKALVNIDLEKHPNFKQALKKADNKILARIQFKKDGKPIINSDGYEEHLFEMSDDIFVELELDS